jgi:uncharacterized protein YkwD
MGRTIAILCAVAGLARGVPGQAAARQTGRQAGGCAGARAIPIDAASLERASAALACLVNRERTSRGIAGLRPSGLLAAAARNHSDDMAANDFFSHTGSDGSSVARRIVATGYPGGRAGARFLGETLAWGAGPYATPAQLVASLRRSPQHRRTMLDRHFRDVGVGLVLGSPLDGMQGGTTATLDFGRR